MLAGRIRFLDQLWLPSILSELTQDQILIINRYRESVIEAEGHYVYARRAKRILVEAVISAQPTSLIEVGCGKFPIDAPCERYLGIDIDEEAIMFVRNNGRLACVPCDLIANAVGSIDCVVSAYAMHFAISDKLLQDIDGVAADDAIFCFNFIADESLSALNVIARLSPAWPLFAEVKTPHMARREFFFVAGRSSAGHRVVAAAQAMRACKLDDLV